MQEHIISSNDHLTLGYVIKFIILNITEYHDWFWLDFGSSLIAFLKTKAIFSVSLSNLAKI